jgi:hypothetical protein
MPVTRKEFLLLLAGTAAAACGGSSTPPNCAQNGTQSDISANHGHSLTVSKADIAAGVDKTYDIRGGASHSHLVTLTAADFAKLAGNNGASEQSTVDDSHSHTVTITCA